MYDLLHSRKCDPPGTFREGVPHPGGHDRVIEKAVIIEHRFAFFFWMKWYKTLQQKQWLLQPSPTLIAVDWHRDLAPPTDQQKIELAALDPDRPCDVAPFVWTRFDQTNDGHLLSAAWLNLIGDIILLKHSAREMQHVFRDHNGAEHRIFEFRDYSRFENFVLSRRDENIFLDIDLDYFIHGQGNLFYSDSFRRYSDSEIKRVINIHTPCFRHLLSKIDGITLALEPAYCGGISNSCRIMDVVHSQLFDEQNNWRHLGAKTGTAGNKRRG